MRTVPDTAGPDQIALDLDGIPAGPIPQRTADVLALLRLDPIHDRDRARIVAAVLSDAVANGGQVNLNRVRAALQDRHGDLDVRPQMVGATINGLTRKGVLRRTGWDVNEDSRGGNAGKPQPRYELAAYVPVPSQRTADPRCLTGSWSR